MTDSASTRLRDALHERADEVRPADLRERALLTSRRLRRRTRIAVMAATVAVVGLAAATVAVVPPRGGGQATLGDASPAAPRFILTGGDWFPPNADQSKLIDVIPEVQPDGTLRVLPAPAGLRPPLRTAALPDGRLAVLGQFGTNPDARRLVILAANGTVAVSRDLPTPPDGNPVTLRGASNTEVYLTPKDALYAHDIATGAERELRRRVDRTVPPVLTAHANASQVAVVPGEVAERTCSFAILDPRTGQSVKVVRIPLEWCSSFSVRLSPDGRRAAAHVSQIRGLQSSSWLFFLDLDTGNVLRQVTLGENRPADTIGTDAWVFWEYAWSDPNTVRMVTAKVPAGDLNQLAKSLDIQTFTV